MCPDGSWGQTNDLVNYRCPTVSLPRNQAIPPVAQPSGPSQADVALKANAEKESAESEEEEKRIRSLLNDAKKADKLAEEGLEKAKRKADALQKQADAATDPNN